MSKAKKGEWPGGHSPKGRLGSYVARYAVRPIVGSTIAASLTLAIRRSRTAEQLDSFGVVVRAVGVRPMRASKLDSPPLAPFIHRMNRRRGHDRAPRGRRFRMTVNRGAGSFESQGPATKWQEHKHGVGCVFQDTEGVEQQFVSLCPVIVFTFLHRRWCYRRPVHHSPKGYRDTLHHAAHQACFRSRRSTGTGAGNRP